MLIFFPVAAKINSIFIFTKTEGTRLAIANTNFISSCYEDEYYFYFYENRRITTGHSKFSFYYQILRRFILFLFF